MYTGRTNAVVTAKCPYFISETRLTIGCEGVCKGCRNIIRFETEDMKDEYIKKYCRKYPNDCVLYEFRK